MKKFYEFAVLFIFMFLMLAPDRIGIDPLVFAQYLHFR